MASGRSIPSSTELIAIQNSHQVITRAFDQAKAADAISAKLKPLLPWFETDIFLNEKTRLQKSVAPLGLAVGFAGSYSGYTLGNGFGQIISSTFNVRGQAASFIQTYFGIVAYTPIAILIGLPTQNRFQYYMGVLQRRPELPVKDDMRGIRYSAAFLSHFLSLFAGIPYIHLQYVELESITAKSSISMPAAHSRPQFK